MRLRAILRKGAGPVRRLAQGVLGIVVFAQSKLHTNKASGLSYDVLLFFTMDTLQIYR